MGWFSRDHEEAENSYNAVNRNEGSLSHELVAGAGSFMAMRAFENKMKSEGRPANHAFAKEMLAAIAGAEVDKLIETKGADFLDREQAKRQAVQKAHAMYDAQYGQEQY